MFNFGMIRVVEYLSGHSNGLSNSPNWSMLTSQVLNGATKPIMCRLRYYMDIDANIGVFDSLNSVPVFNEHFIITLDRSHQCAQLQLLKLRPPRKDMIKSSF